jgi:hypothetical protein
MGQGAWSTILPWPLIGIHSALLPNGDVLTFGTNQAGDQGTHKIYDIWDPKTGLHTTLTDALTTDEFCSGVIIDSVTGNIILEGGDARPEGRVNLGIVDVNVFDYRTNSLIASPTGHLNLPRWYGSLISVGGGNLLALGGENDGNFADTTSATGVSAGAGEGMPERYTPGVGWTELTGAYSADMSINWYYPRAWVSSNGFVFGFDTGSGAIFKIDVGPANGAITPLGNTPFTPFAYNPAAEYAPDKILTLDGNGGAWIMDISGNTPTFTQTNGVGENRAWANLTDLADGTVLLTGGSVQVNDAVTETNNAMIWNPETGQWTNDASAAVGRLYHSATLLLPDATVLSTGGGAPGPLTNLNAEIYTPGYLLNPDGSPRTDRPIITSAPATLEQGQTFTISLDNADVIQKLELITFGATTHSYDAAQREISLQFTHINSKTLQVTIPSNTSLVTDGYWMLFADNANGTPSVASTIKIGGSGIDVYSPQFNTTLTTGGNVLHTEGSAIYQLTHNAPDQVGTLMSDHRLDLGHDFSIQFSVQFSGGVMPADGLAFVLHNDPAGTAAMGGDGSGLGAAGLQNGIALDFNVYSGGQGAPHLDVMSTADSQQLTPQAAVNGLADGNWHNATVTWNAATQTLEYYVDGAKIGQLQANIVAQYLGGSQDAYFGFTGATGALSTQISVGLDAMPYATFEPAAAVPVTAHPNDGSILDVQSVSRHLAFNGAAAYDTAHAAIVLTPDVANNAGSAFLHDKVDLTHNVSVEFETFFAPNHPADGIAFVLENDAAGANALGGTSAALGALGMKNGLAINFDTHNPSGGSYTDVVTTGGVDITNPIGVANIADGGWHEVGVSWNAETHALRYWVDGALMGQLNGDIAAEYLGNQTSAYLGFTGATGAATNIQEVRVGAVDATFAGTAPYGDQQDPIAAANAAHLNGSAAYNATTHVISLTSDAPNEAGTAFLDQRIDLTYNFQVSFDLNFGANAAGGDGIAFILANSAQGANALGSGGDNFGVGGIANGLAIAFDTHQNVANGDMAADHGEYINTDLITRVSDQTQLGVGNVKDGNWHNVVVSWNATDHTLTYWFDGAKGQTLTEDIAATYIGGSHDAYLGFGAGAGGFSNQQEVHLDTLTAWFEGQTHPTANGLFA